MNHPDLNSPVIPRGEGADGCIGAPIELPLGQRIQLRDAPIALLFAAVVADSRSAAEPQGACTVRLSVLPERGEVSTFYLSLDPGAPKLATVSALGYRISLRELTRCPEQEEGTGPRERPRATVLLQRMR